MTFTLTPGKRLLLLALIFVACFCLFSVLASITAMAGWSASPRFMRVLTVMQDIFVFIVPALATAMLVTRQPAQLLCLNTRIPWLVVLVAIVTMIVAVPMMNSVISWNASLQLPSSLQPLEAWMRRSEAQGTAMLEAVMGGSSVIDLVMALCTVGVLAALSEELLFRGALQRLLATGGMAPWVAVAVTAVVFSAIHMQFYGFVPRLLLGLFLGFLLVWTRCLWVPVLAHLYNNGAYVVSRWLDMRSPHTAIPAGVDDGPNLLVVLVSTALTALGILIIYRFSHKEEAPA